MIKKSIGQQNEDEASGRDSPSLIDVGFLLLIGFVLAATLDPRGGDLGMTPAKAPEQASEPEFGFDRLEPELDVPRVEGEGGAPSLRPKVDDAVSALRFTDVRHCFATVEIRHVAPVVFNDGQSNLTPVLG
ncbi:MAG: hypothetical protein WD342_04645 [Verrucomicrobiales bacterium]